MPWTCQQVNEERLRAARSQEEYALHLAALEWSLAEPIIINGPEDIKSRQSWWERLQPYDHQVQNLITFCRKLPVTLIADDVGLGKTISAGLILAELIARRRVSRALVLCPKILAPQWLEELESKFGIAAKVAVGSDLDGEFRGQTPVVVTTYDSARDRLPLVSPGAFGMLILDEAHKLRNLYGTQKAPQMATRVREALERRVFNYVLMLTATPIQNRLWDLYSLLDCLTVAKAHKNPLGSPEEFENTYIARESASRRLRPKRAEQFKAILRQYLVRMRRGEAKLLFPEREVRDARLKPTPEELQLHRLVATRIAHLPKLLQSSLAQALMSSPQALAAQMENMIQTDKFAPHEAAEARRIADSIGLTAKLCGLLFLASNLQRKRPTDWRMVVFTIRKETQKAIGRALAERGITHGYIQGGEPRQNEETKQQFRKNPPGIHVIISTDAGAEGINLQVANVLVNYDLPWNPMIVEQRIGRVQRLGSIHAHVVVWNLVLAGTVEEHVVATLMQKLQLISHAVGDIEAILEPLGWDGEGEEADSFESQIRELVVKSLIGQDVSKDTELKRQSIERAHRKLEEQREEIDSTLGHLDSLHRAGPTIPKLTHMHPSVPAADFVLRAKRAEGARVECLSEGLFEAQAPGKPRELFAFGEAAARATDDPGVFMGNVPKVYLPGTPPFERLAQYWVDNAGHRIVDLCPHSAAYVQDLGRKWCTAIAGAHFRSAELSKARRVFQGSFTLKTKAGNAVDSYEKLITADCRPHGHFQVEITGEPVSLIRSESIPSEAFSGLRPEATRVVERDRDVQEFCRFYQARYEEEKVKAAGDERKLHKIRADLVPSVFAEVVAIKGILYETGVVSIHITLDGTHDYSVELHVVPLTGQVLHEPLRQSCAVSGRSVPVPCLGVCAISGKRALRHLLAVSEASGRMSLPEYATDCEVSGQRVLRDELPWSGLTSRQAIERILDTSASYVSRVANWRPFLQASTKQLTPPGDSGLYEIIVDNGLNKPAS